MKRFLQESTGDLRIRAGLLWLLNLHGEEEVRIPRNLLKEMQDILEGKEEEIDFPADAQA